MVTRIMATELARSLSDILSRVRDRGERFIIERNGEPVATLMPPEPKQRTTFRELGAKLRDVSWPLEGFADDLEEIQSTQTKTEPPSW